VPKCWTCSRNPGLRQILCHAVAEVDLDIANCGGRTCRSVTPSVRRDRRPAVKVPDCGVIDMVGAASD
jgi:hypothetical protein